MKSTPLFGLVLFALTSVYASSALAVHRYSSIVEDQYTEKIYYQIDDSEAPSEWTDALGAALQEYNDLDSKLNLALSPLHGDMCPWDARALVTIKFIDPKRKAFTAEAQADFPVNGRPGAEITINTPRTLDFDADDKKALLMHEIGHTLGIDHTNGKHGMMIFSTNQDSNPQSSIFYCKKHEKTNF